MCLSELSILKHKSASGGERVHLLPSLLASPRCSFQAATSSLGSAPLSLPSLAQVQSLRAQLESCRAKNEATKPQGDSHVPRGYISQVSPEMGNATARDSLPSRYR